MLIAPVYYGVLSFLVMIRTVDPVYISRKSKKSALHGNVLESHGNHLRQKYSSRGPEFKHDRDVRRYLKILGVPALLWRCRNGIQHHYKSDAVSIPSVELYCEGLGKIKAISWFHNGKRIDMSPHYRQQFVPHHSHGRWYSWWLDFTLQIYNATQADAGLYTFQIKGAHRYTDQQFIFVDISRDHRQHRKRSRHRKLKHHKKLT